MHVAITSVSTCFGCGLILLRKILHLADRMPKAFSTTILVLESLLLKILFLNVRFAPGYGLIRNGLTGMTNGTSPRWAAPGREVLGGTCNVFVSIPLPKSDLAYTPPSLVLPIPPLERLRICSQHPQAPKALWRKSFCN